MRKLSPKNLVDFRRKSERAKKIFVENFKSNQVEVPTEGGGDYWVSCLSAICNSYRQDDLTVIDEKIIELQEKLANTTHSGTKNMYRRNIDILKTFRGIDKTVLRPKGKLTFLRKSTGNPILTIKGLQVEAKPSLIYSFGDVDEVNVGAIWFTAKVSGYKTEDIGMLCEIQHRFLRINYTKKYQLISRYCMTVDVLNGLIVDQSALEDGRVRQVLLPTLDEINALM